MLSSWQIAQIHAQQSQQFGAAAAYSQQLSMRMPPPYQGVGLGATGMGPGGFGQGGYNYGGGWGSGYGPGNSFGNSMTSMIGGVGNALGGASSFVGGIGGMMMGGGLIGGAMALPGMALQHISGSMMQGAHEQAALERTLSQFNFQNAGSRTGHGFSRNDSMQIGNMVRQMERIPEMLTSFGELNRLMDKMGQMGLMQGVRDAGEFMRKFRDTTNTLRDLAKQMGTTMEGALQAFGEARLGGFYSKGDITRNVLNRQVTGSLTGMNQGQIGALQQYGSEMAHAYGGSRAGGTTNMLRTASQLGALNQMGILSNNDIMEMTGKEGAAGIQDLSGQMAGLSYKMGNSNVGQALTLALGKMENGRYTGEMDEDLVARVRSGELGLNELKAMARQKASTRGAKLSFAAHKNRLRTNMASSVGAEGMGMELQEILGERGWQNPDATNLVMQRFGASEEQANLLQKLMPNLQGIGSQIALAGRNEQRNSAMNSAMAEHGWDAIKHRISKKLSHYTTDWAKDMGVGVRDYFQNWADDFLDDLSGRYTTYVTKRVSDAVKFNSKGLRAMSASTGDINSMVGGLRMDVGSSGGFSGLLARGAHSLGGGETQGEKLDWLMGHAAGGRFLHHGIGGPQSAAEFLMDDAGRAANRGNIVLDSTISGRASYTNAGDISKFRQYISGGSYGQDQLNTLKSAIGKDELSGLTNEFRNIMRSGDIAQESDMTKRTKMIYDRLRQYNRGGMSGMDALMERAGVTSKTALSKAIQKGGMKDVDIVAALQTAAGGDYRGAVDFGGLMGDVDVTNQKAISDRLTGLDRKYKDLGGDNQTSWSELKGYLDKGGDMAGAATALLGEKGMFHSKQVTDVLSRDASKWSDKDKAALRANGIDPDRMAAKMSTKEGQAEVDRLLSLVSSGKMTANDAKTYLALKDASGLNDITGRFRERGANLNIGLKSGAAAALQSKEGKAFLAAAGKQASALSGIKTGNDVANFSDSGELADALAAIKDPTERAAAMKIAGPEVSDIMNYRKHLRGSGGLRQGMGLEGVLKAAGMEGLGFEGAEGDFRKQLEGVLGKDKKLDNGKEMDQLIKILTDVKSKGLSSAAGDKAGSTQVSEQDIAKSISTMSENNLKATQILANLAAGKTGKDAIEGVSK